MLKLQEARALDHEIAIKVQLATAFWSQNQPLITFLTRGPNYQGGITTNASASPTPPAGQDTAKATPSSAPAAGQTGLPLIGPAPPSRGIAAPKGATPPAGSTLPQASATDRPTSGTSSGPEKAASADDQYSPCSPEQTEALKTTLTDNEFGATAMANLIRTHLSEGIVVTCLGRLNYHIFDFPILDLVLDRLRAIVNIYGLWLLPALYGALGAALYHMRRVLNPILPNPSLLRILHRITVGATIVFPEPTLGLSGLRHAIDVAQPRALLTTGAYGLLRLILPELWSLSLHLNMHADRTGDPLAAIPAEHPALISFTSGSTGKPKAIVRTHGFLAAQDAALDPLIAPERDDEIDLVAFPVFVLANLARGTTSVLPNWRMRNPSGIDGSAVVRLMDKHRITRALVPPAIAEVLATVPVLSLKSLLTGGGPVFPDLLRKLQRVMPATADIVSVYGSTEAEPIAWQRASVITTDQWRAMETGSGLLAGRHIDAVDLQLVDDEIVVTGGHVNKSYLGGQGDADNKLSLEGTVWHRTGDAGRLAPDGSLWLRGRLSGACCGLYPFEVEAPARLWAGVRRAALVSIDDRAALAIEGDKSQLGVWKKEATEIGVMAVVHVGHMPMDRRHRSKVDHVSLRKLMHRKLL